MSKVFHLQSSFNTGVLDTSMNARVDVKQYYNGVSQGDNVLCIPQGGLKRRPGMEFVADAGEECRVVEFVFNLNQKYLLVFRNNAIDVYNNDVFQVTVVTTYTTAELMGLRYAQSADTMIIVHADHAPALFQRNGSHILWTLTDITFTAIPQFDFNDASSPTGVDSVHAVTFNTATAGDTFKLNLEGIDTYELAIRTGYIGVDDDIVNALYDLPNTKGSGITCTIGGSPTTATITLTGENYGDWSPITGRFIQAAGAATISSVATVGAPRSEDVWSATRGWPKTVTFHEGRLWFGGSELRPVSLWGSRVNEFFNFDIGRSRDDQAIDIALDSDQYDSITSVFSGRSLQVFTAGAEYYIKASPITPENIGVLRQTQYGSKFINPKLIDGATVFIQRTGKAVREFVYAFEEESYLSNSTSLLSPDLIIDPVDMVATSGTSNDDSNYIYIVNSDGTMAVFNTLREQNVAGWTRWETTGEILNLAVIGDDIYFSVKRTVNSSDEYYIEKTNIDAYTDSAVIYATPGTATLTGLTHLEGEEVRVRADESVMGNETVASGQVIIDRVAVTSAEVGFNFDATIKTMPIEKDVGPGININGEKRIVNCAVVMKETLGITINDYIVPFRSFGAAVLDEPITPFTGKKEMYLLGWSKTAQVTIKQIDPTPMTILGLSLEVEVG